MIAVFQPCHLAGKTDAPPSKSLAHRYLIGAALSGQKCTLTGVDFSEDILASMDCLQALGAGITPEQDTVVVDPAGFMQIPDPVLECRESGSTLRFFLPLALCAGKTITLHGSDRLLERPLTVYEELCRENGFIFRKEKNAVTLCGSLKSGHYTIRGDISSQFITGLLFALVYLGEDSSLTILPPFESRSYVDLTLSVLRDFGADLDFTDPYTIEIRRSPLHAHSGKIEGDCSNAAFLEAFNHIGSAIEIGNLNPCSLQGDRVYTEYFRQISQGTPTLDISDCPDLGPVLIALAAMKNGALLTGTDRLKAKESDRGAAMQAELLKLGGGLTIGDNCITVPKKELRYPKTPLSGHNDHRIVMALSVILSRTGGSISGAEAVRKSYPGFFDTIKQLGAKVELS
ncbi:MAG: 3-phosphoshikimate 1-carboxyvinyltransferase [Clostridia bacterium]|nr:3-phosphoshikimate 1-carboxyvinyltransferase [Clostridia bacterium]